MPRNKKTEKNDINQEDLPRLTPQESLFVDLYMFDPSIARNATACYKRAFPDSKATDRSKRELASRLLGKVDPWLTFLQAVRLDEKIETRDSYLSWLKAEIAQAKSAGNYGAAASLIRHYGSVCGFDNHDRTVNINHRSGNEAVELLLNLHKSDPNLFPTDSILKMAPRYGVRGESLDMLKKDMETLH